MLVKISWHGMDDPLPTLLTSSGIWGSIDRRVTFGETGIQVTSKA